MHGWADIFCNWQVDHVNVTLSMSCDREIQICVRDYDCVDGDRVRVLVNGQVLNGADDVELRAGEQCFDDVPVNEGANTVTLEALNGTGGKGGCSQADLNTGEIRIHGQRQRWQYPMAGGSSANINVTIVPEGSCEVPDIPSTAATRYIALYAGLQMPRPGELHTIWAASPGLSPEAAQITAAAQCKHSAGTGIDCDQIYAGYTDACSAVARSSGSPNIVGYGMSESREGPVDETRQRAANKAIANCELRAANAGLSFGTCEIAGSSGLVGASASILHITSGPIISSSHEAVYCAQ